VHQEAQPCTTVDGNLVQYSILLGYWRSWSTREAAAGSLAPLLLLGLLAVCCIRCWQAWFEKVVRHHILAVELTMFAWPEP
jgi:hypothetical protein